MALERYRQKRHFGVTAEPRGRKARQQGNAFVIQKHAARRLHYDLRLELDGVMKSWAVTRGPSLVPGEKRLAVHVEDHPLEYNAFEGTIPQGEYGGGTVMIWDRGRWIPEGDPHAGYKKGHLEFTLEGEKLHGRWHLVRMHKRPGERQDPWLLIKSEDEAARSEDKPDILEEAPQSVASGRDMDEIAAGKPVRKKSARRSVPAAAVWSSKRKAAVLEEPNTRAAAPAKTLRGRTRTLKPRAPRAGKGRSRGENAKRGSAPLPAFVEPCLARLGGGAPTGDDWVHEVKFDGYRLQARIAHGKVQLLTRRGLDWTRKFESVAQALQALPAQQALIDGEVVVETREGHSSFSALQEELKNGGGNFTFYAFDLLHLDGSDLTRKPFEVRKQALAKLLGDQASGAIVRLSEHFEIDGPAMLRHACGMGLEGIISKRRAAPYRSGRLGDWIKTKCSDRQEFVIAGYAPATNDARAIGALIVGYHEGKEFRYAGRVGTGYTRSMARDLWKRLQPLEVKRPPFKAIPEEERGRPGVWVKPRLVAEVDFRGWTHGMRLRHPSFKGLRADKKATEVVREIESMATPTAGSPRLTHPERVYWDDVGLTKQGLADYYAEIWTWIAPHVVDRPLSLVRCPEGASGQCFFQKHASAGLEATYLKLVPENGDKIIAIDGLDGLLSLVQAGVLEIHVRGSTIEHLDAADRIVFDLDPSPEVKWDEVVRAAREVRERLKAMKLESYVKTTGGKGLHVVVPVAPTPWDEVKAFAHSVAVAMATDSPQRFIAKATKRERTGRIFVDYLRNSREATAICAYSTRARPGATVAAPVAWSELGSLGAAARYTVANIRRRLAGLKRDPWAEIAAEKQRLPKPKPARK